MMKPRGLRDLDPPGNHKHPCVKRKGVHDFQGNLNPIGPECFIVKSTYTITNQIVSLRSNKTVCISLLSNKTAYKQWLQLKFSTSELTFKLFVTVYLATIQLSTGSVTLASLGSEHLRMRYSTLLNCELSW